MTINITLDQVQHLAPNIRSSYREAFRKAQPVLDTYKITANRLRLAHFMAQILHESGGLSIQFENLNYSAARLPKVWPSRFQPKGLLNPNDYDHNPQKLANEVYGGRMGNTGPNDGFTYRGRGLIQLTGKDNYKQITSLVKQKYPDAPDFVINPDEVIGTNWCLHIAAAKWTTNGCNELADQDNIRKITRAINGGVIGLPDRIEWAKRTKAVWK